LEAGLPLNDTLAWLVDTILQWLFPGGRYQQNTVYLNVGVFSTVVLIVDTVNKETDIIKI